MATKTAAEIPAETATATQTEYLSAVPLDTIQPHPKNIRHNAAADDELVASILDQGLLQPLVVIPGDDQGTWLLIAGHRRLDGLKQAGYTFAPVVVRHDLTTEAEQIAAMLVENGRRADLTPMEEAEGFDALLGLDWTVEQVSKATGRSKTAVQDRRRLTTLQEKAKTAVDVGQLTIADAIKLAKLPAPEQKNLEKYVDNRDFKYEIERTASRIKAAKEIDDQAKELLAAGVPELPMPKNHSMWTINHADHGMVRLSTTGKPNASDHDDCLAFVRSGTKQYPAIDQVCTDPMKHDADLSEAQLARRAELDAQEAERAERQAARVAREEQSRVARQLRMDTLVAGLRIKPSQLDPVLQNLLRLGLAEQMRVDEGWASAQMIAAADLPELARDDLAGYVSNLTGIGLIKLLAAWCAANVECSLDTASEDWSEVTPEDKQLLADYFGTLAIAGHQVNTADEDLRSRILRDDDEGESE